MFENKAAVYINGINLTHYTVMPLKWGNFLDEQLDEMYLSLRHCPIRVFKPLSPVEIHLSNRLYFGQNTLKNKQIIKRYIVANDSNAEESPAGKKRWNHDLYLIELTKIAECFVVDTITFTNDLGRAYTNNATTVNPDTTGSTDLENYPPVTPSDYKTPLPAGNFYFDSAHTIFPYQYTLLLGWENKYTQTITDGNGNQLFYNEYEYNYSTIGGSTTIGEDIGATINLISGQTYIVEYAYDFYKGSAGSDQWEHLKAKYTFIAVQNQYPLKKWTMKDVINRVLDLAEPLRKGEEPRFKLNAEQAALFDKILAPQFSFTKSTLRECLQQCGKIVHGEPRLDIAQDSSGKYYYEVSFDLYGQTAKSGIYARKYIQQTVSQVIDSYASHLDSNAENLVNALDKYTGVIVEPYIGGYKTVRTDSMYVRITEENMIIPTQFPIYSIEKVECGYIPENETKATPPIDITPWVFESSVYNTQLSSYSDQYPYSKAFGISYTQGQKNLTALNFKVPDVTNGVFAEYAIINILRKATNDDSININTKYPLLAFRVTYTPFYNSRVGQTKVNYQDYPYGAALIYNQGANVIESRYYGENLKGAIARIGNVEKSVTYIIGRLGHLPEAGQMFDDEYYISAVSVEFMPTYIKCTLGLSKDFNRLSQYIGISSTKRYSEVSQTQSVERNTLWKEYIVVGDSIEADDDCDINDTFMTAVSQTFTQTSSYLPISHVAAYGGTVDNPSAIETTVDAKDSITYNSALGFLFVSSTLPKGTTITVNATITYTNLSGSHTINSAFTFIAPSTSYYVPGAITINSMDVISATGIEHTYPLPLVSLPVISSAFGNSIAFSWEYEDNYSAGAISQYAENGDVSGYFQNNYQYTDYYGKMYYYNFSLSRPNLQTSAEAQEEIGCSLPEGIPDYLALGQWINTNQPRVLRKDNREKMQCNFQVDFVSNRKDLIIGSALAAYCPLVRSTDNEIAAKLYIFNEPLNKFINHVEGDLAIDFSTLTGADITVSEVANGQFTVSAGNFTASGKAWAIVTGQTEETETVEDEEGNETPQTVQYGGDVLIAQNMDISAGDPFPTVYFTKKRKIFKEDVWTAIQ